MRKKKILIMLAAVLFLTSAMPIQVRAGEPYITWTSGPGGEIVDTQTAYEPVEVLDFELNQPEDMYIDGNGTMYICDTGNGRIVARDKAGNIKIYADETMKKPTGIHVSDGSIYIADYELKEILIYTMDFQLKKQIGCPTEPIFGEGTKFAPKKLITDSRGNLYVVSEGSTAGLMQFNPEGEFLGYFGANATNTTMKMILQRTFFTEEQLNKLFKNAPPSITNIGIDSQGLIYTVTDGKVDEPIKKLSISGLNLFDEIPQMKAGYRDVDVDANGNTYTVTGDGIIQEFDSYGELLFGFGGQGSDKERLGLLTDPAAIEVTDDEQLYVLDKGQNCIVHYSATEFASKVHDGIAMYKDGRYEESEEIWQEIKKMNSSFIMAYSALGKADYKKQNYDSALNNFHVAEDKEGYSQTYWVYRNQWLQNNLGWAIIIIILAVIVWKVTRIADKKKGILNPLRKVFGRFFNIPLVSQVVFAKKMLKKPVDAYYEMKFKGRAGIGSATILYVWLFILQLTDIYVVSYLFNTTNFYRLNLFNIILRVAVPVFLFIVCNYLVSTITDGEGKMRHLYCGTIYALTPYLVFALPLQIITHALTLNESFIYDFGMAAVIAWCTVLFIMMVKEVHDYSLSKTFKNLAVTAFTIALFLLAGFIVYLLFGQMKDFIISIIQEVAARG